MVGDVKKNIIYLMSRANEELLKKFKDCLIVFRSLNLDNETIITLYHQIFNFSEYKRLKEILTKN